MKHVNLTAYDGVESLENFTDDSFKAYCEAKIRDCKPHLDFIKKYCVNEDWKGNVCEIGSGNGKLLYILEIANLLSKAIGYEVSESRCKFAKRLGEFLGSKEVEIRNQDVLINDETDWEEPDRDLIIGIDNVFQLIAPRHQGLGEKELLEWASDRLRPKGFLLLELWDFSYQQAMIGLAPNGIYRYWEDFPESDPFKTGMYTLFLNKEKDIVWDKTFVKRDTNETSHFKNILRPYSREKIRDLLVKYGFGIVEMSKGFTQPTIPGEYVILAEKMK